MFYGAICAWVIIPLFPFKWKVKCPIYLTWIIAARVRKCSSKKIVSKTFYLNLNLPIYYPCYWMQINSWVLMVVQYNVTTYLFEKNLYPKWYSKKLLQVYLSQSLNKDLTLQLMRWSRMLKLSGWCQINRKTYFSYKYQMCFREACMWHKLCLEL